MISGSEINIVPFRKVDNKFSDILQIIMSAVDQVAGNKYRVGRDLVYFLCEAHVVFAEFLVMKVGNLKNGKTVETFRDFFGFIGKV